MSAKIGILDKLLRYILSFAFKMGNLIRTRHALQPIGSRRGISPPRSHRTVRESLPSYGSSC